MHEFVPVIVLIVGVFAGIWLNRRDFADLKSDMNRQMDAVTRRLDRIDEDLRQFMGPTRPLRAA